MADRVRPGGKRARGSIETLPSGALRVSVYAGIDPVTKRRHYLKEFVPAGPNAQAGAEAVRARLVAEVAERRNPRTSATVDQLLTRYLDQFDGAPKTGSLYRSYVKNHISPFIGTVKVSHLDAEMLDALYAELRRCRKHCTSSRGVVDHRTDRPHECDARCGPHRCKPLSASTIRHVHFILSGAYKKAVRWRWVSTSPIGQADPPAAPKANPDPPTPADAARILREAWSDPDWGTLLWLAMTTGARRGEICAIRWPAVSLDEGRESIWLRYQIRQGATGWEEGGLKTHQRRRIALDAETVGALRERRRRCEDRATALGLQLRPDAFVFSDAPDGATFKIPSAVTHRYDRMAARLGIDTTLHKLRHYSATELILAGVDIRTVAGRLGHAGGGTTTLRTYTAWVSEADQRAAAGWTTRMSVRPDELAARGRAREAPRYPYEVVAAGILRRIDGGELQPGDPVPSADELAAEHSVSIATARRAVALVREWAIVVSDGTGRPRIAARDTPAEDMRGPTSGSGTPGEAAYWSVVVVRPGGGRFAPRTVRGVIGDPDSFRSHLVGIVKAEAADGADRPDAEWISVYELHVYAMSEETPTAIFRWA